jgi:hypothetical protein
MRLLARLVLPLPVPPAKAESASTAAGVRPLSWVSAEGPSLGECSPPMGPNMVIALGCFWDVSLVTASLTMSFRSSASCSRSSRACFWTIPIGGKY